VVAVRGSPAACGITLRFSLWSDLLAALFKLQIEGTWAAIILGAVYRLEG